VFTFGREDFVDDETHVLRSPGVPLAATGYTLGFRYTRVARRLLQTMDVLHVHHPFLSGRLALAYGRPLGIPIVFTHHTRYDLYAQVYLPILPDQLGQAFLQAYMPAFCRDVDLVIAPSQGLATVLREMGVDSPVDVIPNGVDLAPFRSPEPIDRASLGIAPDDVVLIWSATDPIGTTWRTAPDTAEWGTVWCSRASFPTPTCRAIWRWRTSS
jgi:glycosyltransferase involved in cell wall biosynthesis